MTHLKNAVKNSSIFFIVLVLILVQINFILPILKSNDAAYAWQEVYAWDGESALEPMGEGTFSEPYIIISAHNLMWISNMTNSLVNPNWSAGKYFSLRDNINLEDYEWTPIGDYSTGTATSAFQGNFDGNNYTIYNINLKNSNNVYKYSGLFGYLSSATIQDLQVKQVDYSLDLTNYEDDLYIGSLAGYATNSTISRINNDGSIRVENGAGFETYMGGIAGYFNNGTITKTQNHTRLYSSGLDTLYAGGLAGRVEDGDMIESFNRASLSLEAGTLYLGGLVGELDNTDLLKVFNEDVITAKGDAIAVGGLAGSVVAETSSISASYNRGNITLIATDALGVELAIGGLFGAVQGGVSISESYNSSAVLIDLVAGLVDTTMKGAMIGYLDANGSITDSYYNNEATDLENAVGVNNGTEDVDDLTRSAMQSEASYTWDFNGTWDILGTVNGRFPMLRYVGNYSVQVQVFGGGKVSTTGINFYELGNNQVYSLTANPGWQIKEIYYGAETLTEYEGRSSLAFTIQNDGMPTTSALNFAVVYQEITFTQTQMFYYLVVVGGIILLMIVGTIIINHNYDVKMSKLMEEKKKNINVDVDKLITKEEVIEVKEVKKKEAKQKPKQEANKKADKPKQGAKKKTVTCPKCGRLNYDKSEKCSSCGEKLK